MRVVAQSGIRQTRSAGPTEPVPSPQRSRHQRRATCLCRSASMAFTLTNREFRAELRDDGRGFDAAQLEHGNQSDRHGIVSMRGASRAARRPADDSIITRDRNDRLSANAPRSSLEPHDHALVPTAEVRQDCRRTPREIWLTTLPCPSPSSRTIVARARVWLR